MLALIHAHGFDGFLWYENEWIAEPIQTLFLQFIKNKNLESIFFCCKIESDI